jgi:hypothetical protein
VDFKVAIIFTEIIKVIEGLGGELGIDGLKDRSDEQQRY